MCLLNQNVVSPALSGDAQPRSLSINSEHRRKTAMIRHKLMALRLKNIRQKKAKVLAAKILKQRSLHGRDRVESNMIIEHTKQKVLLKSRQRDLTSKI